MAEDATPRRGIADLKDPTSLAARREELDTLRSDDARDWALNRAFYRNDQWVIWNRVNQQVESLPVNDGDKPRWKVRITSNQITPGIAHHVALMTKTRPVIRAMPDSGAERDIKAAQVAEALYEWLWKELDLTSKLQTSLVDAQLSQGYWKITWDALAGKPMTVMLRPDGQVETNPQLADAYKEELEKQAQQMGIDPQQLISQYEKTIYVGEINVECIPGENVWLDTTVNNFADAKMAICRHAMDPDEVYSRWKKKVEADSTPDSGAAPLAYRRPTDKRPKTTVNVYIGYFRPQAALPKGRVVVWVENPAMILEDGPWPYPFTEMPLVHFPGIERPSSVYDEARTTLARSLQKELNRTISQIVQHKDLAIKPQMMAPAGSLRLKLTDEPGIVNEYTPVMGLKPEWRDIPNLPGYSFEIVQDIQQRIDRIYNRVPTQRDQLPARVDSGNTVELIQEAVADQLTPEIRRLEASLARAGKFMALLAKTYYIEPRFLNIVGPGGAVKTRKFMNSDLAGGYSFHATMDTGLPRTRAGRFQQVKELLEMQLIDPRSALKHLDLADYQGLTAMIAADEDQAEREQDKLVRGEPINLAALQQAVGAVQQGINPQTGQPFQSPDEMQQAQQMIEDAALQPLPYENKQAHVDSHTAWMKTLEFESLPMDVQQRAVRHLQLTQQEIQSEQPTDPKSLPGLNISASATTSAKVMAKILNAHGIETDENEVAEEPLETSVYDSMDKPDTDSAGNDVLTAQELAINEQAHQLEVMKAQHGMQIANEQAAVGLAKQQSQANIEAMKAAQQQRHAEEMHKAKVAAAKRPPPAPAKGNGRSK